VRHPQRERVSAAAARVRESKVVRARSRRPHDDAGIDERILLCSCYDLARFGYWPRLAYAVKAFLLRQSEGLWRAQSAALAGTRAAGMGL